MNANMEITEPTIANKNLNADNNERQQLQHNTKRDKYQNYHLRSATQFNTFKTKIMT